MTHSLANTLIVMPAFNEEAVIGDVIREVYQKLPGVACLVVSDGSSDDTAKIARDAGAFVAELPFNLGVGGAMRVGFKYAVHNGYRAAVQIDADGQHNPDSVPDLLAGLTDADIVIGARFAGKGNYTVSGPRKWAMKFLSAVLSHTAQTKLTDTTSGLKANGPRALELFAETYPAEYLGDTIEALVIAGKSGLTIRQVPAEMRPRAGGTPSHAPFKSAVYLGRAMMALVVAYLRPKPNTHFSS
ncbi:glycosyltransferase family 2 protein [Lysinibacter cavernae]|uniref:Glycosyltransferase involved in cell wall biosynthesis n=1 Tax=Lysinibacter cavernae TaxID=1640652 RepID=A0A7X5R3P4_9MICO|nr:glycosyltransferase family 2 protein [Lysinibacter cavernae]NIH55095.1 glycosyltransferase involved in cell wall biosynthesis [Lysinibacter cavernae]